MKKFIVWIIWVHLSATVLLVGVNGFRSLDLSMVLSGWLVIVGAFFTVWGLVSGISAVQEKPEGAVFEIASRMKLRSRGSGELSEVE